MKAYMEYWIASCAFSDGKKSFTATSLCSFFLSTNHNTMHETLGIDFFGYNLINN